MKIVKEKLEINEVLEKKINNLFKFNIKAKLGNGSIINKYCVHRATHS